jgi:two-component system CheB/CheR fusion protein
MLDAGPVSNPLGMELIDCIELPVLVVDRDLTLIRFNPAAAKLLSLTHSDYGRQLHSIQMLPGMQNLEELCEHVIASGSSHRVEVADGAGSWFSLSIGCHKTNQNIHGAVLTFTNVTGFRESLERAIEEREYTKAVINTIADALVIVDGDLRVQTANQAFYALFQTSRERSQGGHFYQLGGGDWDIPRLGKLLHGNSPSNNHLESLECDHEFQGGGRRRLLLNARRLIRGSHVGQMTLITIQDITSRKEAEQVERRLAAIVESSDDAIISKDLNGIVISWNQAAEKIFGYSAKEMIGQSITTIIPPELQDDEQKILETIGRGERIEHFETVRLTKSGEPIDVSLTISPVRDEAGRVVGVAKISRDITQEKMTEQSLRTTERLVSVGRMAATVAHEINNPLEAVTNLVYLAKGSAVREDVREYLDAIEGELDRISHVTKQTLGFYRESIAASAMRVGPMLDPLISVFGARARNKGIEIRPEIRQDPEIFAIAGEIRQLIANLLSNSIDAVDSGGLIRIRVDAAPFNGQCPPGVRITVADSGPGIPPSVKPKLFEPFFTTKKDVGTGLGLWVCTNIVKRHHGSIRVKSSTAPGQSWTVFSVFLPSRQESVNERPSQEV